MKRDYSEILKHVQGVVSDEKDIIANLGNVAAILKPLRGYFWIGFYRVSGDELILGPFQGPPACTRLKLGHGVCGTAWQNKETVIVPDVNAYAGHVACNSNSKSEIALPIFNHDGNVAWILDVDSDQFDDFDQDDAIALEHIADIILHSESFAL